MLYYYIDYKHLYYSNSLIDFAYMLSLTTVSFGALWKNFKSSTIFDLSVVTNAGGRRRWVYLLLYPAIVLLVLWSGMTDVYIGTSDIIAFAVPIFLYWGSCKYVQISIEKETLLRHQNKILEQRVAEQVNELSFLANQDTLTTLFNRRYFMDYLDSTIQTICQGDLMAIMMIDLDRFKVINDTFGHDVGDKVLIEISFRLTKWNNFGATVARLGGDEFAIMLAGKYMQKDIEDFCVQIIDLCGKPIIIGENLLSPTMSIGIALISEDVRDGKTLMKYADISMYSAKSQGYNKYQFYDPIIDQDFKKAIEIEVLLKKADIEKDFSLFYQPQYSLPDMKLIGAEALIRWENSERGTYRPTFLFPLQRRSTIYSRSGNG
jgi:diguanylate cyclase (GGDEF)-like protein